MNTLANKTTSYLIHEFVKSDAEYATRHFDENSKPSYKIPLGKRLFDIAASFFAILLLSPVLIIVAILIRLESKGPIIYKSKRVGTGYHVFNFYKFRSMDPNADKKSRKYHISTCTQKTITQNL